MDRSPSRYPVVVALACPGAPLAQDDTDGARAGQEAGTLEHRERAVTGADSVPIAPREPGVAVDRASVPEPSGSKARGSGGLDAPTIDSEAHEHMTRELRRRLPARSPEWSDREDGDPGSSTLDPGAGGVIFGDGEHGTRPSTGRAPSGRFRYGDGTQGPLPSGSGPGIDDAVIRQVARALREDRVERAVQLWRRELAYLDRQGNAPPRDGIDTAIDRILEQAYAPHASLARPPGRDPRDAGGDGQLAGLDLQAAMQRRQQHARVVADIGKRLHDAARAVIRNIR